MPDRLRSAARRTYSLTAYAAFLAVTAWAVLFLADRGPLPTVDSPRSGPAWTAVAVDLALWLAFGLHHSVLARDRAERALTRVQPARLERSTYVLVAALLLGLLCWQWRALPATVWRIEGRPWVALAWVGYGAGWVVAVAATYMVDHWEFAGLRQAGWLDRLGRPAPTASVSRRWLYGWVRHPMMAGLLVAFWVTPVMTAGHLLYAAAASAYIAVGLRFEERDLRRHLGAGYADYARQVPRLVPGTGRRRVTGPAGGRRHPARSAQAGPEPAVTVVPTEP